VPFGQDHSIALVQVRYTDKTIIRLTIAPTRLFCVPRVFFEHTNPAEQSQCRQLFVDNKLAIAESPEFESEFGSYPVLYVDLLVGQCLDCASSHADGGKMMVRT